MYKNPKFDNLKNYHSLQELLGKCLDQHDGYNMSLQSVRDCASTLNGYSLTTLAFGETSPVSPSRASSSPTSQGNLNSNQSSPSSKSLAGIDEIEAGRIIKTLNFLISDIVGKDGIFELNSQDGMSLPGIIVQDIARFIDTNRPRLNANQIESNWYSNQLSIRLKVLRQFYGIHSSVTITKEILCKLWELMAKDNEPIELNEFLHFLNKGCTVTTKYHMICESNDFISIFTNYICNKDIKWNKCNNKSLKCFVSFYNKIEDNFGYNNTDPNLKTIQLDALWRINLEIEEDLARSSSQLLLKAYDSFDSYSINSFTNANTQEDGRVKMLKKIMLILQECKEDNEITPMKTMAYSRCIDLLYESIIECKKIDIAPSHSACGSMNRFNFRINYRKKTKYSSSNIVKHDNSRCIIDKGSEGTIEIELHPYQSIHDLKRIISEKVNGFSNISKLSIEKNNLHFDDHSRLVQLAPFDEDDIYASLTVPYYQHDYSDHGYDNHHLIDCPDVGMIISSSSEIFESLLSISKIINDEDISKKIWDVLMMIPSQPTLSTAMNNGIGCVDKDICDEDLFVMWSKLIKSSFNPIEISYKLQIIDNLLQPNPELMNFEIKENSDRFKKCFLATKGYKVILKILMDTPSMDQSEVKDRFINRIIFSVTLHILHNLLFGVENDLNYTNQLDNSIDSTNYSSTIPYVLPVDLLSEMQDSSLIIVEKLLSVASDAAVSYLLFLFNCCLFFIIYLFLLI
jgi:hypothetical protein